VLIKKCVYAIIFEHPCSTRVEPYSPKGGEIMQKYECMYILNAEMEDEARKELIEKISGVVTSNKGEIEKVDEWGKRRLAYPINFKNEGYYVLLTFSADPELPKELERNLRNYDEVMRFMVIKLDEKKQ